MGRCRFRPVAYRLGLGFLALGFVLVALGYAAPAWIRRSGSGTHGLWHWCNRDWSACEALPHSASFAILMGVRAAVAASLFFYLVSFAMALRENCCSPNFYTCCLAGRKTEVFAFVAEIFGIAGMVLYSVDEYEQSGDFRRLSWAHALCDAGLAVSLIGSIMMACAQQTLPAAKGAAGRIVANNPLGYESLANNRSASLHSRSTQPSPFQGRSTPVISGPYPSPAAAAAAANAVVSPKQQHRQGNGNNGRKGSNNGRNGGGTPTTPQQKKQTPQSSPYPTLESQASPSRRRKSSGQGKQFAGVHNQGKHPPVFASQHVQEEWVAQQTGVWSEEQDVQEPDGVRTQRALKAQIEQQQRFGQAELTRTWSQEDENQRSRTQHSHMERLQHQENEYRTHTHTQQRVVIPHVPHGPSHGMPPPPKPPKPSPVQHAQYDSYGNPLSYSYPAPHNPDYAQEGRQQQGYQYPVQGYFPEHTNNPHQWSQQQIPLPKQQQRPDSGNFPDPPPPEQLLCYEEERVADPQYAPLDYQYYSPHPGAMGGAGVGDVPRGMVQPMVVYRAPSMPGQSPVTETVALRPHDPHHSPHHSPRAVPAQYQPQQQHQHYQQPYHQQQLQQQQQQLQQHGQTFPRQTPAQNHDPHCYSTFGR